MKHAVKKPQAEIDLVNAALYYENEQLDLGLRFVRAIKDAVEKIEVNTGSWQCALRSLAGEPSNVRSPRFSLPRVLSRTG